MSSRALRARHLGCVFGALLAASCASGKESEPDAAGRRALLDNLAARVIAPAYADFAQRARALAEATASESQSPSAAGHEAAQSAFRAAMLSWQRAEVLQVGPAARVSYATPGGMGLRDEIYPWPQTAPCGVDRALVAQSYRDFPSYLQTTFPSERGLSALELLLFDTSHTTHCQANDAIVSSGSWAALSDQELSSRRSAFAAPLAAEVVQHADQLVAAFADFQRELAQAGAGSRTFSSTQAALNAVTDALFYVDLYVKDMKLADPAGLSPECLTPCPERVEHRFARVSKEAIVENLKALRDMFRGLPPPAPEPGARYGLSDLLRSLGQDALAGELELRIDAAIAAAEQIPGALEDAALLGPAALMPAYDALQAVTDLLKTQFLEVLSLTRPMSAAGDND